jgi:hypothetical protein
MLPDPREWSAEALESFRSRGLPPRDWPDYRDRYIVEMTRRLADRHQAEALAASGP